MKRLFRRWFFFFRTYADRWWCAPLIGLTAFLDLFIFVIPTDGLLITATVLAPRRWWYSASCVAIGSAVGASLLGLLLKHQGIEFLLYMKPNIESTAAWHSALRLTENWGAGALFLVSLSPLPQHPAVAVAAMGGITCPRIFFVVLVARLLKYHLLTWLASHAPKVLGHVWGFGREINEAQLNQDVPK